MSDKDFWRHTMTFYKRVPAGLDPATRLPSFTTEVILTGEPCDIEITTRRQGQQTPAGTVYNDVKRTIVRLDPDDRNNVPDEDDEVEISGTRYRVLSASHNSDAADNRYMGSWLEVQSLEPTDSPNEVADAVYDNDPV